MSLFLMRLPGRVLNFRVHMLLKGAVKTIVLTKIANKEGTAQMCHNYEFIQLSWGH